MREDLYPSMESDITFLGDQSSFLSSMDFEDSVQKKKYVDSILSLVGREREGNGRPLRVAIIGPVGVGKSSLINTIGAAFRTDRWRQFANYGHHGGQDKPITALTTTYKKCCNEADYPDHCLPTLIDIAGFPNEDTEKWRELLRIVFYGRLHEGETLGKAQELCENEGLTKLKERYAEKDERLKVDRIIFVASAVSEVPRNLINCVLTVAQPSGRDDNPATRTIPVFGVMTKKDKFASDDRELQERQRELMEALGLGNAGHRFLLCSNYCDDVDGGERTERVLPHLDVPVLKFLRQVFDPVIKVLNEEETMTQAMQFPTPPPVQPTNTPIKRGEAKREWLPEDLLQQAGLTRSSAGLVLMAVEAVLVAAIFFYVLQPAVDVIKMRASCEALQDKKLGVEDVFMKVESLRDICSSLETLESVRKVWQMVGLFLFLLIRFGVTFVLSRFYDRRQ